MSAADLRASTSGATGLRVRGLDAAYARGPKVLFGVDLVAEPGLVTALLGPNGSGKSTLLKALVGLVPSTGAIELDGERFGALGLRERARRLAYVPQRTQLAARLTVRAVVELGRFAHRDPFARSSAGDDEAVAGALDEAGVAELAERRFTELSGGEQQRVLLARALATGAETLLLDEPTSSQDVRHVLELHGTLRRLADRGRTVLVVLHDLAEVRRHADRAVLLDGGRVHAAGTADEIVRDDRIGAVYGVQLIEGAGLGYRLREQEDAR
ncbi:Iron(3+)-hydroxamate import ATP-binding protein FhuC [Planctomycetes bacterium Pla163]|uniref:Iron(3+)-hydroxamate import ATP-binding protein FhuC n=1 Tax=Rohdeia mirabilis TaxID=2528008 RepID=A0A518D506_9BACT|nr:Iron(3+)-hydroxamate import ATP-binding protein FhuC [Planctomycetes bacterium Pla163]